MKTRTMLEKYNLEYKLTSSKEILEKAFSMDAYSTVFAFSGGDDSLTLLEVIKHLGYRCEYMIHANTGTGFPQTLEFVIDKAKCEGYETYCHG